MPRPPRYELTDIPQHVVQRGNNRQRTFFADADYRSYLAFLGEASRKHDCDVHAYVLMTNHVHLLVTPRRPMAIAKVMQSVGRRYVRRINDAHGRVGTLWQGRYWASLVAGDSYLWNCYRYIELNPVRSGLVPSPDAYPWSSHAGNVLAQPDALLRPHDAYRALAPTPSEQAEAYRAMFGQALPDETLVEIRRDLNTCRPFGPESFKQEVEALLKRRVRAQPRGRPRKKSV